MFKSLSLSNFKAFSNFQTLPIKPITLIFGPNSSGKSSIIHSLLFCHEVLTEKNFDVHFTKISGDSVDLGGFKQFIFNSDDSKFVSIKFILEVLKCGKKLKEKFDGVKEITVIFDFGIRKPYEWDSSKIEKKENDEINICLTGYDILTDGIKLIKMSARDKSTLQVDLINSENKIIDSIFKEIVNLYTTSTRVIEKDKDILHKALEIIVPELKSSLENAIPNSLSGLEKKVNPLIIPVNKENREETIIEALKNNLPNTISEMLGLIYFEIENKFKSLIYLGPLRSYPDRHFLSNYNKNDKNWIPGGGYAWEMIANNDKLRDKINKWFSSEKLQTKYKFEKTELIPDKLLNKYLPQFFDDKEYTFIFEFLKHIVKDYNYNINDNFNKSFMIIFNEINDEKYTNYFKKFINNYDSNYKNSSNYKSDNLESLINTWKNEKNDVKFVENIKKILLKERKTALSDLLLIDQNTNSIVSHRDVGIGISQILPVIAYANGYKSKTILIEQPEIHIHPALQAELGDVFIESALGENKNTFIIETHSEYLILRILRRIRETAKDKYPQKENKITPNDISVLYIEPTDKGSIIMEMPVNEQGEFIKGWPGGFFEERLNEIF